MNEKHATLPWRTQEVKGRHETHIFNDRGYLLLAETRGWRHAENAALIVRAVNSHQELLETLKSARRELNDSHRYDYIDNAIAKAEGRTDHESQSSQSID